MSIVVANELARSNGHHSGELEKIRAHRLSAMRPISRCIVRRRERGASSRRAATTRTTSRALSSSHAAFRWGQQWRSRAGSLPLNNRELERQVLAISVRRPRVVCNLDVEKPFFAHHVSQDLLEPTQRLAFEWPPEAKLSAICPEPFAEFAPSGPR